MTGRALALCFLASLTMIFTPVRLLAQIIKLEPVATGLTSPVAVTHAGDGSGRLFVTLQPGQVVVFNGAQVLPEPFLDIGSLVSCCGERGLLSVAFHKNYSSNGLFYVNYTNTDGDTVIARYTVSGNPDIADPDSAAILLVIAQPYSNHNGGQLQFGPDGCLYVGTGDGGSGGDPLNNAQNMETLLGKMLRLDVDSDFPYSIPTDNPFVGDPGARDEIWALGLRNPWRFSFDRMTGDLFIADVGQSSWEEVNYQPVNSGGGENYGWRLMEGNHCFTPSTGCNEGTLTLPVVEYPHSEGCSITGGYRYRGSLIPRLHGAYLFGDYCSGKIWSATENDGNNWTAEELLDTDFMISSFGEDQEGEVYLSHLSSGNGAIYRIVSACYLYDFDCDDDVDITDIMIVASRWNSSVGEPAYEVKYDLDNDGDIDVVDVMIVAVQWGWKK
jgi:glucose/arabinose dehydrogenase